MCCAFFTSMVSVPASGRNLSFVLPGRAMVIMMGRSRTDELYGLTYFLEACVGGVKGTGRGAGEIRVSANLTSMALFSF